MSRVAFLAVSLAVAALMSPFPPTAAADEGDEDVCFHVEPSWTRGLDRLPVWHTTDEDSIIVFVFIPRQPAQEGGEWEGTLAFAGLCGLIKEIIDCLLAGGSPEECTADG